MPKQLHISIPNPCHEDWSKMTPNEQGAFCNACQKNVIDFSNKTENEIYEILSKAGGKMCGRFTTMQLERPVRKTEIYNGYMNWRTVIASVLALFSIDKLQAQTNVKAGNSVVIQSNRKAENKKKNTICIKGQVVNAETNQPITQATVQLGTSNIKTVVDSFGNFSMEVDMSDTEKYGSLFTITASGYEVGKEHILGIRNNNGLIKLFSIIQADNELSVLDRAYNKQEAAEMMQTVSKVGGVCIFIEPDNHNTLSSYFNWEGIRYVFTNTIGVPFRQ